MPVGRPSIFSPKEEDIHGQVTRLGAKRFESARRALSYITGRRNVSDGDVIEFLAHCTHEYGYYQLDLGQLTKE